MRLTVGKGIDQYINNLTNLEMRTDGLIGRAVYEGAKIVTDAVSRNIDGIPTDDRPSAETRIGLRSLQKAALKSSLGIAKHQVDNGYYNVKVGFDGYNNIRTDKYPSGQPNAMIARTIEAGNSFTRKHPFVGPAVRSSRAAAEKAMADVINKKTMEIMK